MWEATVTVNHNAPQHDATTAAGIMQPKQDSNRDVRDNTDQLSQTQHLLLLHELQCNVHSIDNNIKILQSIQFNDVYQSSPCEDEVDARVIISLVLKKVVDQSKQLSKDVEATTKKVKDRTVMVGTSVKGASHWVAAHTSKSAKQAMMQARSGLSIGEKTTLFLTEKISAWSRKGFTHVFMFLMMAAYTAMGAALFIAIEGPHEIVEKLEIEAERSRLIKDLYIESRLHSEDDWESMAKERLQPFEEQLYKSFSHGVSSDTDNRVWTFWKAMFFCSTITTTIGYGHMAPVTTAGRTLCIVYAIIGIPLMLILMADFGKLFTRILKSIFRLLARINRSARCIKIKSNPAVASCRTAIRWLCSKIFFCRCAKKTEEEATVEEGKKGELNIDELIQDDHFNLPISLALVILVIYILIGCVVFPIWEDWTFFESFYFVFISISTIGFGDFVPQHPGFMMATTLYFVFGLALTAMCINIIQEKLTDTFREASAKMKQSFSKIMKAELEAREAAEKGEKQDTEVQVHDEQENDKQENGKHENEKKENEKQESEKRESQD